MNQLLKVDINYFDESFHSQIALIALGLLHQLDGLNIFDIQGVDHSRTRVITTLIHGYEPSGFISSHNSQKTCLHERKRLKAWLKKTFSQSM